MGADTHCTRRAKPTPGEIADYHRRGVDRDINCQKDKIETLTNMVRRSNKDLRRSFTFASLSLAGAFLGGVAFYSVLTDTVEEKQNIIEASRRLAHQICAGKVAAGHISNTDAEIATCQKIFYAEKMESSAAEYTLAKISSAVLTSGLFGIFLICASDGRKTLKEKRKAKQGIDQANEKLLCALASRQTADSICCDLSA